MCVAARTQPWLLGVAGAFAAGALAAGVAAGQRARSKTRRERPVSPRRAWRPASSPQAFRSRLGGRFRRGLGGGRSGRLGCRLRGGLGCGRFRSRLRRSLGCRLGRRFRGGLRSRFGGGLGCRLGGRGLRCRFFAAGFAAGLAAALAAGLAAGLAAAVFAAGLAAGFAAGLAAAFAAGLTLTPVSFSICLVSVSTLPCSSFTSLRLGTPRREMALFRRLSKASSSSLHLPSARSRTSSTLLFAERAEAFAAPTCASTSDFASFQPSRRLSPRSRTACCRPC